MNTQSGQENSLREIHKAITERLERIEKKIDITNGRVTRLENWRYFIMGGLAVITILIVPIVLMLISQNI